MALTRRSAKIREVIQCFMILFNTSMVFPKIQMCSAALSLGFYITAMVFFYYVEYFQRIAKRSFWLYLLVVFAQWIVFLGFLKLCIFLRLKSHRSGILRHKIICFVINQSLMMLYGVVATILADKIKGSTAIFAFSFLLLSICFWEVFLITEEDVSLADSVYNIVMALTCATLGNYWILTVVAFFYTVRGTIIFGLREYALHHGMEIHPVRDEEDPRDRPKQDTRQNMEHWKKKVEAANTQWTEANESLIGKDFYKEKECESFVALGKTLSWMKTEL